MGFFIIGAILWAIIGATCVLAMLALLFAIGRIRRRCGLAWNETDGSFLLPALRVVAWAMPLVPFLFAAFYVPQDVDLLGWRFEIPRRIDDARVALALSAALALAISGAIWHRLQRRVAHPSPPRVAPR